MTTRIGTALVVGAGIGGIRSALDLAESGYRVLLIDRAAHIGGILSQLDIQFPTDGCGMCRMLPLLDRDSASQFCLRKGLFHENIQIETSTEISGLSAEGGRYTVRLHRHTTGIDAGKCVGCGVCTTVCPVDIPDMFNAGRGFRKAVYLPVPHAVPNAYVIDAASCTRCGACAKICPTGAVQLIPDRRSQFSILVVDDEPAVGDSLKEWLLNEGFSAVTVARSGASALAALKTGAYRLMLADIKMPGMDGVELLEKARAIRPELTVVMMTAYATVETAVQAMKLGALDYFMKPFDPDALMPCINRLHQEMETALDREITVDAVVIGTGAEPADPLERVNPYGYRSIPNVVTSLELERLLSAGGPSGGILSRPSDGRPANRIAWLQCVGSRNTQLNADYCSAVCCMIALKQARMVQTRSRHGVETVIFYMDMRVFGKGFQRYLDEAVNAEGVRLEPTRVHSIFPDPRTGDPAMAVVGPDGRIHTERFDMVVLSAGQRPSEGTRRLARLIDIPTNPWGFLQNDAFAPARSARDGIFLAGSAGGPKTIGDAVIQASAAAMEAARAIHANGGSLAPLILDQTENTALRQAPPKILVVICRCSGRLDQCMQTGVLASRLHRDPNLAGIAFADALCTAAGWQTLDGYIAEHAPNRLLIGACHPYLFIRQLRELGRRCGLPDSLLEVIDLGLCVQPAGGVKPASVPAGTNPTAGPPVGILRMAMARLKHARPLPPVGVPVTRQALVVGGGIAGLQAALALAGMGFPVHLVEAAERLGGNLNWIQTTVEGQDPRALLKATAERVAAHPQITVHRQTTVLDSRGTVGSFITRIKHSSDAVETVTHGVTILATGGREAATAQYGYGTHDHIITQKQLEEKLAREDLPVQGTGCVVMIQCAGSREPERNYCSRVCCNVALKQALRLKSRQPDLAVYVLYRDMMSHTFAESYYTQTREAGVIFIRYDPGDKPRVKIAGNGTIQVKTVDPILALPVEISADWLVLATGISPNLPPGLAAAFGIQPSIDGFFQEADPKWRPLDAVKEGLFACGLVLAPYAIAESVATGQAAAMRALRILARPTLPAAKITALVRPSLCALCQRCIPACPYEARWLDAETRRIEINPAMCQGCGACATACPNGAATLTNCARPQMLEMIDAALAD